MNGLLPLHMACQNNCDAEVVALMIDHWPGALRTGDDNRRLPLHHACRSSSLETVKVLVQAWPESLHVGTTNEGRLPLHEACMLETVNPVIIDYLLECCPATVQALDSGRCFPLHLACYFHKEFSIIKSLVEAWPDAVRAQASDGRLPLHLACNNKRVSLDIFRYLIESDPATVQMRDRLNRLPLHGACKYQLDSEIIRCLVLAWPESVSQQITVDDEDMCQYYSEYESDDSEIGEMDDEFDPEDDDQSSMVDDAQGSMDDEVQNSVDDEEEGSMDDDETDNMELEESIFSGEVEDESTMTGNNDEQSCNHDDDGYTKNKKKQYRSVLPLDVSVRMYWRRKHDEDLESTNRGLSTELVLILTNGIPPLHFACMHPCTLWYPFRMDTLQSLSSVVPEEQWMQFYNGMLPFHYACRAGAPKLVLKWCENRYPDAVHTLTMDTSDTPLHCYLSSRSSNQTNLTTPATNMRRATTRHMIRAKPKKLSAIEYLIKKHRDALHSPNRHGFLPLHVAAMCDVPLDILFYLAREFPETLAM